MVGRWGMSPAIGPVSVLPSSQDQAAADGVAPATRELVDTETRRIIEECYEQALATLRGSRDRLDRLADTLLDRETLEEEEAYAAVGISPGTAPAVIPHGGAPGTRPARRTARGRPGRPGSHHAYRQPVRPVKTGGHNQPGATRARAARVASGQALLPGPGVRKRGGR